MSGKSMSLDAERTMFRLCLCHCGISGKCNPPLSLDFLIRESVPRQVNKKSRVPEKEDKGGLGLLKWR